MVKEKRIKSLIIGLLLFSVGLSNVNAASYTGFDFTAQLYDNVNGSLTAVTTSGPTAGSGSYEGYIAYAANSSGGAWGISSPTTLLSNHTYTLTASIPNECGYLVLSTYNRIGVGTSLSNAKTSYQDNTNVTEVYSKVIGGDNFLIQFAFTPSINGSYIVFPFATTRSCNSSRTLLESIAIEDLGVNGATQEDINNSLNQQTNEINTTINNLGTDIKDGIKDTFEDCIISPNLFNSSTDIELNGKFRLWSSGAIMDAIDFYGLKISVKPNTTYITSSNINSSEWSNLVFFTSNMEYISGLEYNTSNKLFTTPDNTYYITIALNKNYEWFKLQEGDIPDKEICQNKIDETNDKLDETNQNLGDIKDSLTDSSPTDMSDLGNSAGWLPPGPVDSILNLPLTFFLNLSESLTSECRPVELTLPFVNEKIYLPCIRTLYDKMGVTGTIFTTAGVIASAVILFNYLLALYKWVDDTLTLRENTMPGYYDDKWGGGA